MAMQKEESEPLFPPQNQDGVPGKEYLMDPLPVFSNPNYKPTNKLQGKVALVTGGDSGIGKAVCWLFAKEGATIAFTYMKFEEEIDATNTLEIIKEAKTNDAGEPIAIATDLKSEVNCNKVVDEVITKYGRIDVLVNNAAELYPANSLDDITEERLERIFKTNTFSLFYLTKYAVKHMKEGSSIINTASAAAYTSGTMFIDYACTKAAVVAFTKGMAAWLVDKKIRVNGVAPGPVWTPMIAQSLSADMLAGFGTAVLMERAAQPVELAPSYLFLATDQDSSFFTGTVLHPEGGGLTRI